MKKGDEGVKLFVPLNLCRTFSVVFSRFSFCFQIKKYLFIEKVLTSTFKRGTINCNLEKGGTANGLDEPQKNPFRARAVST